MAEADHRDVVVYAGVSFYREVRAPDHIVLTPTDDPNWLLRHIGDHRLPGFEVKDDR